MKNCYYHADVKPNVAQSRLSLDALVYGSTNSINSMKFKALKSPENCAKFAPA